uniref:CSON002469 protein n=1 Tax=Culicoides sonorensis TaxID=179676 RepID=A0A336LSG6_CULSO
MPDITNEHLMKLIYRVIKKVDLIEEKLNQVIDYVESQKKHQPDKSQLEEEDEFKYRPIGNDKELDYISTKIENDEIYKRNLRNHIKSIPYFALEDIFTEDFLCEIDEEKPLEDLIPYEDIFVYLKRKEGMINKNIKSLASSELARIKDRIKHRKDLSKKRKIEECYNSNESFNERTKNEEIESEFIEFVEVDDDTQSETDEESNQKSAKKLVPVTYIKEVKKTEDYLDDDDDDYFTKIENLQDLARVCEKIRTRPSYLKSVRKQFLRSCEGGMIRLNDLFTEEFISGYNISGLHGMKNLTKLLPYQTIYLYIKKKLGISMNDIEAQARAEVNQIKGRLRTKRSRIKKRLQQENKTENKEIEDNDDNKAEN